MIDGIYDEITNEEYHGMPWCISKTGLDKIHQSPAHYKAFVENPPKPTPAMQFGTAVHMAILEPELFKEKYVEDPGLDRRTKAGKAEYEQLTANGVTVLSKDDWAAIQGMRESAMANDIVRKWVENGYAEMTGIKTLDKLGVAVKVRPDLWVPNDGVIVDIKTTYDARPEQFGRAAWNFRYHVQAALYLDMWREIGKRADEFFFVAIEKDPPYALVIYETESDIIKAGRGEYVEDLSLYAWCVEHDEWPAYPNVPVKLQLPRWAIRGN